MWGTQKTINDANSKTDDMIIKLSPQRKIVLHQMILCASVTTIKAPPKFEKKKKEKKSKQIKKKISLPRMNAKSFRGKKKLGNEAAQFN